MANTTRIAHPTAATTAVITIGDFEGKLWIRRTGGFANLIRIKRKHENEHASGCYNIA